MTDETAPTSGLQRPKRTRGRLLTVVGSGKSATPRPRRYSLSTLRGCRREMALVYSEAREGRLDPSDAAKLAYVLSAVGKLVLDADLELRLARLELEFDRAKP